MPNVTFDKTSNVTGRLQLEWTKEELGKKLNEELRKESKRVNLKGFRRGKTPISALRKLMGNQVLAPMLDREIQQALFGYVDENELKIIFSPVPVESDEELETMTATRLQDLKLTYDLALEPDFEIKLPEQTFTKYVFGAGDDFLDEQIANLRRQMGESQELEEGSVAENDVVDVTLKEVDGELENSTKLYLDSLTEDTQEKLIGKSVGEKITVDDLTTLEENTTATYVSKYLLDLDEEQQDTDLSGKSFDITIDKITRIQPAELDEEFYTKFDPSGEVKDEAALREKIAADNGAGFNDQGTAMLNFEVQKAMVEGTEIELPLELMRKIDENQSEQQFESFERAVRWMLIRNKYAADKGIQLEYEDIRNEATVSLLRMLGGQRPDFLTDEFIDNYVQNMLKDEKQREELSSNALEKKIMASVREEITTEEKALDADTFNDKIKTFNEENTPPREEE